MTGQKPLNGDFGDALMSIRDGKRVARDGWNGKGMWLSLTIPLDGTFYVAGFGHKVGHVPTEQLKCAPWIGMRTADESYVPWVASQTDMLAVDWRELADEE